jgi:hypothetical protein
VVTPSVACGAAVYCEQTPSAGSIWAWLLHWECRPSKNTGQIGRTVSHGSCAFSDYNHSPVVRNVTTATLGTIAETVPEVGINIAEAASATAENENASVALTGPVNVVGDKGYLSNESLKRLGECEVRSYISEPDRGRRNWTENPEAQHAVYGNRRRIQGEHRKKLLRSRGELVAHSFAHAYETGGMRRLHLRGRDNILKRLLIHLCRFNLSLIMRKYRGKGTPRGRQGYSADDCLAFVHLWIAC